MCTCFIINEINQAVAANSLNKSRHISKPPWTPRRNIQLESGEYTSPMQIGKPRTDTFSKVTNGVVRNGQA